MIGWVGAAAAAEPEALWQRLAAVPHLQAEFTQVQERHLLSAPLVSRGTVAFERPDKLRWEVTGPGASVFVVSGTTVAAKMPGVAQVAHLDLASQPKLAGLVSGLTVWLAGDLDALRANYDVTLPSDDTAILRPKDPVLQKAVATLTVHVAQSGDYLSDVTLVEPDGDRMTITLSAVDLGSPIPASRFTLP